MTPEISVIVPLRNESGNVGPLATQIFAALERTGRTFELILVDDESQDDTWAKVKQLCLADARVKGIRHLRNGGQSAALCTGFRASRGPIIATLDGDLQNDPADIPQLVDTLERTGATAVAGYRATRRDTSWKRLQSRIANGVRNRLNGEVIRDTGCSLKAFRTEAVRALPLFTGMHRFLPTLIKMEGGTVTEVPVGHRPRKHGVTKYGMWNRVWRSLQDAFAVRWMQRRALRYRIREEV